MTKIMIGMALAMFAVVGCNTAPSSEADKKAQSGEVESTVAKFKEKQPSVGAYMKQSYGWAVFPTVGKGGVEYQHRTACCLETQAFPDSPNKQDNPAFPNCILKPGETYTHTMVSKFSW